MTMFITTLNSNITLKDFIEFYESFPDFNAFLKAVSRYYSENFKFLSNKQILDTHVLQNIITSFNQYFEALSLYDNIEDNRKSGSYFTPKSVCRFINQRAWKQYSQNSNILDRIPQILDPSSGLGFFLIDMFFMTLKEFSERGIISELSLIDLINGIHGCDINQTSVELSKNLFLSIMGILLLNEFFSGDWSTIKQRINANFISEDFLKTSLSFKPDIIVGNPPYVRVHKLQKSVNTYLRNHFFSAIFDFDLYVCFFEKAIQILTKGGILAFITPEKYLMRKYARNIRTIMLLNSVLLELIDISRCNEVFPVDTYPIISVLMKTTDGLIPTITDWHTHQKQTIQKFPTFKMVIIRSPQFSTDYQQKIHKILDGKKLIGTDIASRTFEIKDFLKFQEDPEKKFLFYMDQKMQQLEEIFHNYSTIGDTNTSIFCGTPRSKYYHEIKHNLTCNQNPSTNCIRFIVSKNIAPYCIFWESPITFDHETYTKPCYLIEKGVFSSTKLSNFKFTPKILMKANSRYITAAVDNVGYIFIGVYGILWKLDSVIHLDILNAIFNSNLINYYLLHKYKSYMLNSRYLSINSTIINDIPLPGVFHGNRFHPAISNSKFHEICVKLTQSISELRHSIQSMCDSGDENLVESLKRILHQSQSEPYVNNNDKNSKIMNHIQKINKFIYDLYAIPRKFQSQLEGENMIIHDGMENC
ncbi:MAG: Eco57I restriction-modification methylase domain-containing protein [Candidatus Lokiarchaeota archaeon]|nr:Eco57I restriction-modification methylase domain-containing protein [Candidatus Lokiarchaeota archaeon]